VASYILDRNFRAEEGLLSQYLVVEPGRKAGTGAEDGSCRAVREDNPPVALGVTVYGQYEQDGWVGVRMAGVARCYADSPVKYGEWVVALKGGRVMSAAVFDRLQYEQGRVTEINCLGFAVTQAKDAGDIVEVFIAQCQRTFPVRD
jgi:hypothetical protein